MKTTLREDYYRLIRKMPAPLKNLAAKYVFFSEKKKLKKMKTPVHLIFFVTNRCNLRCSHCFYWRHINKSSSEMNLEEIKKIVKSLKNSLESVIITGGEPFLREDLVEVCKIFEKYNKTKKIIIATNGMIPEKIYSQSRRILEETNLDLTVQVSIDGFEETHDKIRGVKGCFKNAVETVKRLKQLSENRNFNVTITTTISKNNADEIENLIFFVKNELKAFHGLQFMRNSLKHSFNVPRDFIADFDSEKGLLETEEMEKIYKEIKWDERNLDSPLLNRVNETLNSHILSILKDKKPVLVCRAGIVDAVVYSNGDVSMCEFTKPFANLKDFELDFYKLWSSEKARNARLKIKNCFCIHSCNLINSMKYDSKSLKKIFS